MSGHHNITIYVGESDISKCRECKHGELIKSAYIFTEESYLCWEKEAHNLKEKCTGFATIPKALVKTFKHM